MTKNPQLRALLRLAVPSIISNVTVPLLGLADLAITGHIGSETYISAIATGTLIFNTAYWLFGFLRMGTSGLTAQAYGRRSLRDADRALGTSLATAAATGLLMILLQTPLLSLMTLALGTPGDALPHVEEYCRIVVYGAPAVLALYAMNGWCIGMQDTRLPMVVAIVQNLVNIAASLVLVFRMGWNISGIAAGTLIAQWAGVLLTAAGMTVVRRRACRRWAEAQAPKPYAPDTATVATIWENPADSARETAWQYARRFAAINRDIFLRTLCLVVVNAAFTAYGSRQGTMTLAVNALLITLYTIFSYFMDGFAYAGEALGGRYCGARDHDSLGSLATLLRRVGAAMALAFTLLYCVCGTPLLRLLTSSPEVVTAAEPYLPLAALIPVCGFLAFVYDGLAVGITATRQMLLSTALAAAVFFGSYYALALGLHIGNYALWTAFLLFLATRGLVLLAALRPRLR